MMAHRSSRSQNWREEVEHCALYRHDPGSLDDLAKRGSGQYAGGCDAAPGQQSGPLDARDKVIGVRCVGQRQ
jgi:hypothetical protein